MRFREYHYHQLKMTSQQGSKSPFLYSRLSHASKFRIFHLFSGRDDDTIQGSLTETDIGGASLAYSAISYVWGDSTKTSTILCNGQRLSIPATLGVVLRRLRTTSGQKLLPLWADSICIDQSTSPEALSERSHQVRQMRQIFSLAEKVYIDLSDISLDTYHHLNDLHMTMRDVSWTDQYPNMLRVEFKGTKSLPRADHAGWHSLAKFVSHPWFTRMWVIQEFAMAKRIVLLLGDDVESDADFIEQATKCGCYFLYHDVLNRDPALSQIRYTMLLRYMNIAILHKLRVMAQSTLGVTLQQFNDVLLLRENFAATDSRDFVYALLGLAPPNSADLLAANYEEHSHELGRRLYLHFLAHGYGVYGLYHGLGTKSLSVSWAIQLESKPRDVLFNVISNKTSNMSNACGDSKDQITYCDNPQSLIAKAYVIDKISLVFPRCIPSRPSASSTSILAIWLRELLDWLVMYGFAPLDRDAHSFGRTLCCGRYRSESDSDLSLVILSFIYAANSPIEQTLSCFNDCKMFNPNTQSMWGRIVTVLDLIQARNFATSINGRFCFIPEQTQVEDQVVIISGAPQPFVLRPVTTEQGHSFFRMVGGCYIDGMMQGEVLSQQTTFTESTLR